MKAVEGLGITELEAYGLTCGDLRLGCRHLLLRDECPPSSNLLRMLGWSLEIWALPYPQKPEKLASG